MRLLTLVIGLISFSLAACESKKLPEDGDGIPIIDLRCNQKIVSASSSPSGSSIFYLTRQMRADERPEESTLWNVDINSTNQVEKRMIVFREDRCSHTLPSLPSAP